jgi:hypothetical protein
MADRADLVIYQGDDYAGIVLVTNTLPPETVIAGYTAKAQIREDIADAAGPVVVEIVTSVASPLINLSIPRSQTLGLCGDYLWDLEVTSPEDQVTTLLYGDVHVKPEVTRA